MAKRLQKTKPRGWWTFFYLLGWALVMAGLAMMAIDIISVVRARTTNVDHLTGFFASFPLLFVGSVLVSANWANRRKWFCSGCGTELFDQEDKACRACWTVWE
jgi:hypothetical protein